MKLCEFADHKWSMDIEEGEVYIKCQDSHGESEIQAMREANDGREPACAIVQCIVGSDINVYDIPISFNYYWTPGGYEDYHGESTVEIKVLPKPGKMHPVGEPDHATS
jgi:hypothetical protein